ncbi:GNAT family N-acetyltransferase [Pseudomonas sp. 21LCFQ02]|uniref:GNAT family N-acetyltransferase n=1 Tax=unclassified Pseudomonas TaxID=196821 RepID=UPI0004F5E882|nr:MULTISPECIES: GNAT family N-acetyltransferase [unclassified Pseudomonas]MCO8168505.1 GNAT family N-acetyltransferase [Pseudomonas sp. 21LCFQ02]MCO8169610.1 GNAT family N-acetyltransferase [Pseudomonas sp. 21LCFQ02]BAP42680.1 PhnO-like protein [Pseudomonas sp. StFLB209]
MNCTFLHLEDPQALAASFGLMRVLRPHLDNADAYVAQLQRQAGQGYRLLAAMQDAQIVGLAGYRELENLLYGRFVYVDDLLISPALQRSGLGGQLLDQVRQQARQLGCDHFVLDTGLHMALAQRFYFRQGLLASGMHFTQRLRAGGTL